MARDRIVELRAEVYSGGLELAKAAEDKYKTLGDLSKIILLGPTQSQRAYVERQFPDYFRPVNAGDNLELEVRAHA